MIIKLHIFIQLTFNEVILVSQSNHRFCMLTWVGSSEFFFLPFLDCFFSSILSFDSLITRNWAFFFFAFYEVIVFSMNFYLVTRYDPSTFDFFKIDFFISISPFNIWLIENWSLHFVFFFFFSIRLSQSYVYDHEFNGLTWFDSGFFIVFYLKINSISPFNTRLFNN